MLTRVSVLLLLQLLPLSFCHASGDVEEKQKFAEHARMLRENILLKIEPQVFVPRQSDLRDTEAHREYIRKRLAALSKLRDKEDHIIARILTVGNAWVLAIIQVRLELPKSAKSKEKFYYSSEMPEPFWIDGVNTRNVVDGDQLLLVVYPAGKASYTAVNGAFKTVRRLATSPEVALDILSKQP